ncbi:putative zinc finger protein [Novymonas esmeraldas]|uniref:Zinc finger protein n=1 Tax=Novymonas esmeraldas TaxID=1808958 RepID=A0AAW0F3S2_9TRYP
MAHAMKDSSYPGMSDGDWRRLHSRVIPNPVPLTEFKSIIASGTVHDRYLAKDLHKIMQELRDLLQEHGELREASVLPLSGRKQELSQAAAIAVRLMSSRPDGMPALRRSSDSTAVVTAAVGDDQLGSTSPSRDSASNPRLSTSGRGSAGEASAASPLLPPPPPLPPPRATASPPSISPRRSSRVLPLTDHIQEEEQPLVSALSLSTVPTQTIPVSAPRGSTTSTGASPCSTRTREAAVSRGDSAERPVASTGVAPAVSRPSRLSSSTWTPCTRLASAAVAHNAATSCASRAATAVATSAAAAAPSPLPAMPSSTVAAHEMAQLNESAPPFFRILSVPRRFQLRFGSSMLRFEIPVQYADGVNSRQLRVYVIPLRHPNTPARWPTAKEIVVYVNKQCLMTPWKRSWPDREREVAKTFLPLDITYLLSRNVDAQHVQIDVHNREYQTPAIVAVVHLRSLEEVTESILSPRLGCRSAAQVRQALLALCSSSSSSPACLSELTSTSTAHLLASNNAALHRTYAALMAEEEDDDGLEADDPIIATKCPISQQPIAVPVRGSRCVHLQCVDLEAYLVSCNKGSYWNCALCDAEMRPRDVQVDTVLWTYLNTFASADAYPQHLRLTASAAPKEGEAKFYWHPSTRNGGAADVVLDESESDGEGAQTPSPRVLPITMPTSTSCASSPLGSTPLPATAAAVPTPSGAEPPALRATASLAEVPLDWSGGDDCGRKRRREDDDDGGTTAEERRGTADDPIEL